MKKLFVYDWYIQLKLIYNDIRNITRSIENEFEVPILESSNRRSLVHLAKGDIDKIVAEAADLLSSFLDAYYPVERPGGEMLQDVIQNNWGIRQEVNLSDFVQPISTKCMRLVKTTNELKEKLTRAFSQDDALPNIYVATGYIIEQLVDTMEMLLDLQREIETILQKGERGILIWQNNRYSAPTYITQ